MNSKIFTFLLLTVLLFASSTQKKSMFSYLKSKTRGIWDVELRMPNNVVKHIRCHGNMIIHECAKNHHIDLPIGKGDGTDAVAAASVLSGVVSHYDYYLNDAQIEKGYVLLDAAYVESDLVLETHKEMDLRAVSTADQKQME